MGLLGAGAGAAEGLDVHLQRLLEEARLKALIDSQGAQQAETSRHNIASEDLLGRQHTLMATEAQARTRELARAHDIATEDRDEDRLIKRIGLRPIGSIVTPEERANDAAHQVPSGLYGQEQPPSMGKSTPEGEVGPSEQGFPWKGTQDQITKAAQAGKHGEDKGVVHDTEKGLMRVYADGSTEPVKDNETGNILKGFHQPPPLVQTGGSYMTREDVVRMLREGKDVPLADPAAIRTRQSNAGAVGSHFDNAQALLDEAEKKGLLGPLAGRTYTEFMAGKIGSTGNDEDDELIGELRMALGLARSGTAMLHGRGGANVGIVQALEKKMDEGHMSAAELRGGLKEMRKWVETYASGKGKPGAAAAPATAPTDKKVIKYDLKGNIIP